MQEKLMQFEKMLERELETELGNVEQTGLTPDKIKTLKDAFKLKKLVKECCEEEEGYSSRRGRSRRTGRYMSRGSYEGASNSFGSYDGSYEYDGGSNRGSSRGNYSGHGKMIQHLERMYDEAEDEKELQMIEEWIRKAEQGQ